jgi:cysteine desulfurase / selenocysteine lyase
VQRRLYFDNAATSFPKPREVLLAINAYAEELGASPGRGAYREARASGELVESTRKALARLLNVDDARQIVFTLNATDALNLAIHGILRQGDHAITTALDHNSVLRPYQELWARGRISQTVVKCDPRTGVVDLDELRRSLRHNTRLISVAHGSNVTGTLQPLRDIVALAKENGSFVLVDAAQSLGHVPFDTKKFDVDFVAFPGHKALLGPSGTGGLYLKRGMEKQLATLREGGTGTRSEQAIQPDFLPDRYEPGSHNALGIAGLGAALAWIEEQGLARLRAHELSLMARFLDGLSSLKNIELFGPRKPEERVAVFSLRLQGYSPDDVSRLLEERYGILTRSGLHCAPFAHRTIGTYERGGTTRLSFGPTHTKDDIDEALAALSELSHP